MDEMSESIDLQQIATAFRHLAYRAYLATLVGSPAKVTEDFGNRMKTPVVGGACSTSRTQAGNEVLECS